MARASSASRTIAPATTLASDLPCNRSPTVRHYVSPNGDDTGPGSLTRPWRTLARALRDGGSSRVVYVRAGTYSEWAIASRGGTPSQPFWLRAYPGERPLMTGRLKITGSNICVSGLEFSGRTSANPDAVLVYVAGATNVEIAGNVIHNAAMSGIYVGDDDVPSQGISIVRNWIADNGTHARLDHGIYFGHVRGGLISGNVVTHNLAIGIKVEPQASNVLVSQNTVVGNGTAGVVVGGELEWSSSDNLVVNNIVVGNGTWGIRTYWEQSVGSGNLATTNVIFANGSGPFWFPGGGMTQQASILAPPGFVSADDYRLAAGSPAIDRALPGFSLRVDIVGHVRPRGHVDLGAYER